MPNRFIQELYKLIEPSGCILFISSLDDDTVKVVFVNNGWHMAYENLPPFDKRCTVERLLKGTQNKGHNTLNLSIKDKFYGPYRPFVFKKQDLPFQVILSPSISHPTHLLYGAKVCSHNANSDGIRKFVR